MASPQPDDQSPREIRAARLQKVSDLNQLGLNPYAYTWDITHQAAVLQQQFIELPNGEEDVLEVSIAGRIMARRVFGKLAFFTLQDETGAIQLFLDKKTIQAAMADTDDQAFSHLKQQTDVGVGLILDQFGVMVIAAPGIAFGQVDHIALQQIVGCDDLGCKTAAHR
mgnify:CR=1 FL=1